MTDYDSLTKLTNRLKVVRNWLRGGMWTVGSEAGTSAGDTVDEAITQLATLREQVADAERERDNLRRDRDFWKESASQWSAQAEFGKRKP